MALFKVFRGDETNLPASMNDGWAYFCTDTGNFYIDWDNGENLVRTQINANYANKLQYRDDEELVEINPQDIAAKSDIPQIDTTLTIEGAAADAKAVGDTIASIPNADWNQNDTTQPSYIENRTHWIEPVDFEWSGNPTFTATTSAEGNIYIFECATTDKVFNICTLSCGGSSWVVPVNQSKWVQFSSDSWVSFGPGAVSVLLHSGTLYLCAKSSGMGGMGTYNISNCGIVTYLPAAYIPSTIARLKDVVTSVNGQKGAVTIDIPEGVPDYTTSDNGKVLSVVDGVAGWSNVNTSTEIDVDNTLSVEGAAADAKAVGEALSEKAPGLMTVNISSGFADGTTDYSASEITAHINAGGQVVAKNAYGMLLHPTTWSNEYVIFRSYGMSSERVGTTTFEVNNDKEAIYSTSGIYVRSTVEKDDNASVVTGGAIYDALAEKISVPSTAAAGQTIIVKSVDENGKPTEWAAADMATGTDIDIDTTLTVGGAAADAKSVGDALIKNLVDGANGSVRGINTNTEIGTNAFAEGGNTKATGYTAHAEGDNTTSSAHATHSEGVSTVASNYAAHAEGQETTASGHASHAEGHGTKASSEAQHVQGKWNVEDTNGKYAHIVGNGYSTENASNAHTVDWNGVGWFAGGLKVGGTGQDDSSAVEVALKSDIKNCIPDWNQNDATQPDYINNRTHYDIDSVFTPFDDWTLSSTVTGLPSGMATGCCVGKVKVASDKIVPISYDIGPMFGLNRTNVGFGEVIHNTTGPGFDFCVDIIYTGGQWNLYFYTSDRSLHGATPTISNVKTVAQLNKKYLPMNDIISAVKASYPNAEGVSF